MFTVSWLYWQQIRCWIERRDWMPQLGGPGSKFNVQVTEDRMKREETHEGWVVRQNLLDVACVKVGKRRKAVENAVWTLHVIVILFSVNNPKVTGVAQDTIRAQVCPNYKIVGHLLPAGRHYCSPGQCGTATIRNCTRLGFVHDLPGCHGSLSGFITSQESLTRLAFSNNLQTWRFKYIWLQIV